jgi:hypothetical protein
MRGIDLPAMPEVDRAYWVSTYPQCPKAIGRTGYRPTRNARRRSGLLGIDLPDCPNQIGRTGYRPTRNARSRSGVLGIDLPAMPEVDRAYWVSTYRSPQVARAYEVSTYPQCPQSIGHTGYRRTSSPRAARARKVLTCPPWPKSIGHTRYPRTRHARSGSYIEGVDFPRPPDAVEPIGHRDWTYWGCRCLVCPSTSGVGGTSFALCWEGFTQFRRAFARARK